MMTDDDADERELFMEAVTEINPSICVETCRDGEELMFYLATTTELPDLIFLDLNMPKKAGLECLMEMACNNYLKRIPVIVYSTSQNRTHLEQAFRYGALGFLRKPNSFSELKNTLIRLLAPINTESRQKEKLVFNTKHSLMQYQQ